MCDMRGFPLLGVETQTYVRDLGALLSVTISPSEITSSDLQFMTYPLSSSTFTSYSVAAYVELRARYILYNLHDLP